MEQQQRKRQISLFERQRFVAMWQEGKSCIAIAKERGTTPATVCRWINRWKQEGNINTKYRTKRLKWNLQSNVARNNTCNFSFHDFPPSSTGRKTTDFLLPDIMCFLNGHNFLYCSMLLMLLSLQVCNEQSAVFTSKSRSIQLLQYCNGMENLDYYGMYPSLRTLSIDFMPEAQNLTCKLGWSTVRLGSNADPIRIRPKLDKKGSLRQAEASYQIMI